MNRTITAPIGGNSATISCERGVTVVVMLYALSIFSVLALTLLRHTGLEATLRTGEQPDLHVVLYAGGAGSPKIIGRLNLPTLLRVQGPEPDHSIQIQAPGPVGTSMTAPLPEGGVYAIRLATGLRVCCDSGTNACRELPWEQEIPEGVVTPASDRPIETEDTEHTLTFNLSSFGLGDNLELDPESAVGSPFGLKAARVEAGATAPENAEAGDAVSCTLQTPEKTLATGALRLQPGVDGAGQINRVSAGTLSLTYKAPRK